MSGRTIASHHGSQAFWRKIACVGSSGPAGAGGGRPAARHLELVEPQVLRRDPRLAQLRAADRALVEFDAARPEPDARAAERRLLHAGLAGDVVQQPPAVAVLLGFGGLLRGLLARVGVDLQAPLQRAAEPDLLGRPHRHPALGLLARGDLGVRRVEREAALVVGLGGGEGDARGGVGLVLDRDVEARLEPARRALGRHLGGDLLVGLDPEHEGRDGGVDLVRLGVRHERDVPQARLGLGRARRVDVDLDLLLVGPARPERDEVGHGRRDRPPGIRQAAQREHVVVDDLRLVADQREHALAPAGVDADRELLLARVVVAGQAQRDRGQRRGLGRVGGRARRPRRRAGASCPTGPRQPGAGARGGPRRRLGRERLAGRLGLGGRRGRLGRRGGRLRRRRRRCGGGRGDLRV